VEIANRGRFLESFKNACTLGQLSEFIQDLTQDIAAKFNKRK